MAATYIIRPGPWAGQGGHRPQRKIEEELRNTQIKKNAKIHTFFQKQPQSSNVKEKDVHVDEYLEDVHVDEENHGSVEGHEANANVNKDAHDHVNGNTNMNEDDDDTSMDEDEVNANLDNNDANVHPKIDIFDPTTWDGLNPNLINVLVKKGPKQDLTLKRAPRINLEEVFLQVFIKGPPKGSLNGDGYGDTKHVSDRLIDHELSFEHMRNMQRLFEMRQRLNCNQTIDKFLAKNGLAFRGTNEKLYQKSDGNFLGLIEMLEEFDPIIKEHVRRIMNDEFNVHYLGHNIQNELIILLADGVKSEIIKKIKQAKYVNLNSKPVTIEESFLGFLIANDTTGKGLFDVTREELKSLGLDIDDMRCQGYDNGANMKGKHQGVQRRFLDMNPRVFYTACGCHSLNLRWQILKDNVKELTVKPLSATRWESRIKSVKPIRFQLSDAREALLEVRDTKVSIIIWYEVLSNVNLVSQKLQSKDIDAIDQVKKLINYFKKYREVGLSKAINEAKEIAIELGVDPIFNQRRPIRRKNNLGRLLMQKMFYFQGRRILESITFYLRELGEKDLKSCCYSLQDALKNGEESDIDAEELYGELKLCETFLPSDAINPLDILNNLKRVDSYPNALVAYRVLLTIPVTVASAERSFSKLKLLKIYLRSSMSQERLNGLAIIAIENDVLETMDYKELIEGFASKNAKRASRFV
ncbi:uncharacterized protein LOC143581729 [Bidens hawaiensis]|uniref:uncharacterized protein LOC143581729 n=1 Tax=Bidens hawaiensis TaxID=980011 RepID=UPI00404A5DC5